MDPQASKEFAGRALLDLRVQIHCSCSILPSTAHLRVHLGGSVAQEKQLCQGRPSSSSVEAGRRWNAAMSNGFLFGSRFPRIGRDSMKRRRGVEESTYGRLRHPAWATPCGWHGHHAPFHVVPPSVRSRAYRLSTGRPWLAINLLPFLHLPSRLRNCTGHGHFTPHLVAASGGTCRRIDVRRARCDVTKRRCRREMASAWTKFHQEGAIVGAGAISRAEAEDLASRLRVAEREVRRVRFRSDAWRRGRG